MDSNYKVKLSIIFLFEKIKFIVVEPIRLLTISIFSLSYLLGLGGADNILDLNVVNEGGRRLG